MRNFISEDDIEQATLQRLRDDHGYELLNCPIGKPEDLNDGSNRTDKRDVILGDRLSSALQYLNPEVPSETIAIAVRHIMDRRTTLSPIDANQSLDTLIRSGYTIEYNHPRTGKKIPTTLRLIDFENPANNRFLAVSQLCIYATSPYRRPDIILYINGLPIVFIELKNSNVKLRNAYDENLTNYKRDIPQLFHTNAICILSNAICTKIGSFTAGWEHFFDWLRIDDEKERLDRTTIEDQAISLERAIAGLCAPTNLLDYLENFVLYYKDRQKIIAQNHQFLGVNKAIDRFIDRPNRPAEDRAKLGVFWHTQGSGKSFSMVFYARKIARKIPGNFTFVIITDRTDLDSQIYGNFLQTKTVGEKEPVQPKNSEELRKFLSQNKRFIFTPIQKFGYAKGKNYPVLSDRDDIIVLVDEAHRSQYKTLADNMRAGLPKANFIAFTGTPLLGKERKTNAWFGDYVSEYDFQQAMDDGATVPLFYEKRVPEMQIQNNDLGDEFYQLLEDEALDDTQQAKFEKKYATELEVIKRDDRLSTLARDIVNHFTQRGYLGKGLVISVDKFTSVRMYDKVQYYWKERRQELQSQINKSKNDIEKGRLKKIIEYMRRVEMAVVISEEAGEAEKFSKQKLDIKPHRDRMNKIDDGRDIESNFKDPEHPLQLVFVCSMWLTGFDAPSLSTLYLDKPMRGHTLMQTIARANRVSSFQTLGHNGRLVEKKNGEIIDYYNVFRNMKIALRDYARGDDDAKPPVQEKSSLFDLLDDAISQTQLFCLERHISLEAVLEQADLFKNIAQFKDYADELMKKDEWRKSYNVYSNTVADLYEACKPEILRQPKRPLIAVIQYLRGVIDSIVEQTDLNDVGRKVAELLDESLIVDNQDIIPGKAVEASSTPYGKSNFQIIQTGKTWDLSKIDFQALQIEFHQTPHKHIKITELRAFIEKKLEQVMQKNSTRINFAQRLQEIVDRYNSGASSTENIFDELVDFTANLENEEERHIREGLTEDELELFDLLKKENMTKDEKQKVKLAAKALLSRLVDEHPKVLIQDWWKDGQTKESVKTAIDEILDKELPETYDRRLFTEKRDNVFQLVEQLASHGQKWAA
jgi:type I restriction enzyme, R subunit